MTVSRRNFLSTVAPLALGSLVLAGCDTVTTGTTSTYTLNVTKIKNYATAGINAAKTVLLSLSVIPSLAAFTTPLSSLADTILENLNTFSSAVGSSVSVEYNDESVKTVVDSLLVNINKVLNLVDSILTAMAQTGTIGSETITKIQVIASAVQTIVAVFQATIGTMVTTAASGDSLSEDQALAVLGV